MNYVTATVNNFISATNETISEFYTKNKVRILLSSLT